MFQALRLCFAMWDSWFVWVVWGRGRGSDWGEWGEDKKIKFKVLDIGCGEKGLKNVPSCECFPQAVLPLAPSEWLKDPNACTSPGEGDTSWVPFPAQVPPRWW